MKKTFIVGVEETIYCPVTYVRLIAHFKHLDDQLEFRVFEIKGSQKNLDDASECLKTASGLILARATTLGSLRLAQQAHAQGIPIVLDIDDYLWKLPSYLGLRDVSGYLDQILALCSWVTTPSTALKELIQKKNPALKIEIIPNAGNLSLTLEPISYRIGFLANSDCFRLPEMKKDFFQAIRDAARKCNIIFLLYYFSNDVPEYCTDDPYLKIIWAGIRSYSSYRELGQIIHPHFALVPLADDHFSGYKSVIKFAEFSSIGSLGIYSRVEPYRSFVQEGKDGFFAENTYQGWYNALIRAFSLSNSEYQSLTQAASKRADQLFNQTQIRNQFFDLLKQLPGPSISNSSRNGWRPPGPEKFIFDEAYYPIRHLGERIQSMERQMTQRGFLLKKLILTLPFAQFAKRVVKKIFKLS